MPITKLGSVLDDAALAGVSAVKGGRVIDEMQEPTSKEEDASPEKTQNKKYTKRKIIKKPNK